MALSDDIDAYAAYLNAPREHFDVEERQLLNEDLAKARAVMETAWLERLAGGPKTPAVEDTQRRGTPRPTFDQTPPRSRKDARMTVNLSLGSLAPFMKAIAPALLSLIGAGTDALITGKIDQQTLVIAITGLAAAAIAYLVPNKPAGVSAK